MLYARLHEDVEETLGVDSMLAPIAPAKTKALPVRETESYQIAESAVLVRRSGCVREDGPWYVHWLSRLRLGELSPQAAELARVADYLSQTADQRRLQAAHLPAIADCPQCKRRLLPNGDRCSQCGNPLWGSLWLTSSE